MYAYLAFLGVSAMVIATPGPDTAMTIRNTLLGGRAGGISTATGIALGQLIWALATSIGIVALLIASKPVFVAVKYAGAAYLVYLGVLALREALHPSAARAGAGVRHGERRLTPVRAFGQGLVSDLGNPKMAVFFASLLPQFVPAGDAPFSALLLRGCIFALMTFVWLVAYAVVVARVGDFLRRGAAGRILEGLTGAVLVALGLRLAAEQR
ncbi:LysE family translocator [Labrys wisconsinensis]|uniref:Threonine/homoserine/homoserine lactone efflux protein n=1 Tax=Labrys wisconsinensis TaxID=425677 RepID=A0ABU0J1Q5_9HYPH|nr:LysE family translocator [Labrys wisconsinensis]MDQ0468192.1 threonine/homoserine/homoserine lactone efflux protein [Labrys wisconsinensis]